MKKLITLLTILMCATMSAQTPQYIDAGNTEVVGVVEDSISNPIDFLVLDAENKFRKVSKDSIVEVSGNFYTVTKTELDSLITNNLLYEGALYKITGVNPDLYGGTDIYLTAISTSELNPRGVGKFYNPKYDKDVNGFGIVKDYVWWTSSVNQKNSGVYAINDVVIWGGKHWTCIQPTTITTKYIIDDFELDTDYFEVIPFNDTDYNIAYDEIVYDYQNDWIIERNEANSNIVAFSYDWLVYFSDDWFSGDIVYDNPIRVFQWGNVYDADTYKGIGSQTVTNSLNINVNFSGVYQYSLTFDNGSYQYNLTFDNGSNQNNLTFDNGSNQNNLTLTNYSYQNNLTFTNSSNQNNLTFDNGSYQNNLTFDNGSYQYSLTFDNGSYQNSLTFTNSSNQNNLTFDNSGQNNLTFDNSGQNNLTLTNKSQLYVNFKNYRVSYSRSSNTPLFSSIFTENNYLRSVSDNIESLVYSENIVSNTNNSVTTNSDTINVDFLLYNNIETTKNQILFISQRNATGATTGTVYLNDVSVGTFSLTTTNTTRTITLPAPVTLRGLNKIRIEFSGGSGGETTITSLRFDSSNETQYGEVDYKYTEFVGGVLSKEEPAFLVGRAGNKEITVAVDDFVKNSDLAEVAFSGSYNDLDNKPDLSNFVESSELATVATTGDYGDLSNTPTIPTVLNDLSDVDVDGGQVNNDVLAWSSGDNYFKPIPHIGAGGSAHALATGSTAGFMSSELYTVVNGLKDFNPSSYALIKFTQRNETCILMNQDAISLLSGSKTFSTGELNAIPYYEGELYFTLNDNNSPDIGFTLQIGNTALGSGITHSLLTKSEALIHVKFNLYFTDLNTVFSKVEYRIIDMDTGENLEYKVNLPASIDITGQTKELRLMTTTDSGSGYTFCVAGGSLLKLK